VGARASSAKDKQSCANFEFGCISAWRCQALLYLEQMRERSPGRTRAACYPVASWVTVPPNVCIKYVCVGGAFQIRCLPAPILH
jgi:hypothetical protein